MNRIEQTLVELSFDAGTFFEEEGPIARGWNLASSEEFKKEVEKRNERKRKEAREHLLARLRK